MATSASPSLTDWIAIHIEELPRPLRSAWLGFSSMAMTLSQWRMVDTGFSSGNSSSSGVELRLAAVEDELVFLRSLQGELGAVDRHAGALVAAHGVHRNCDCVGHFSPFCACTGRQLNISHRGAVQARRLTLRVNLVGLP